MGNRLHNALLFKCLHAKYWCTVFLNTLNTAVPERHHHLFFTASCLINYTPP